MEPLDIRQMSDYTREKLWDSRRAAMPSQPGVGFTVLWADLLGYDTWVTQHVRDELEHEWNR